MYNALIIIALSLVVLGAFMEIAKTKLRNKQIGPLKNALRETERKSKERDAKELDSADAGATIGFLNSLHKDPTDTD